MLHNSKQLTRSLIFLSALSLFVFSCKKDEVNKENTTPIPTTPSGNFSTTFTIDGIAVKYEDIANAAMVPGATYITKQNKYDTIIAGTDTTIKRTMTIGSQFLLSCGNEVQPDKLIITTDSVKYITSPDTTILMVSRDTIERYNIKSNFEYSRLPSEAFFTFMKRSGLHYADSTAKLNGYVVSYVDVNGKVWSSKWGDQTGSTIAASKIEENMFTDGVEYVKCTLLFNCKVYNGTESKTITNGTVAGFFINSR